MVHNFAHVVCSALFVTAPIQLLHLVVARQASPVEICSSVREIPGDHGTTTDREELRRHPTNHPECESACVSSSFYIAGTPEPEAKIYHSLLHSSKSAMI